MIVTKGIRMNQESFSVTGYFDKGKTTKREQFLAEMDQVVPCERLLALIEPHCPTVNPEGGRPPLPLERMFRIYCLQQWYNLSDPIVDRQHDCCAIPRSGRPGAPAAACWSELSTIGPLD